MQELKSCPFCGGEAHTYKNNLWHVACERAHNGCVTMSAFITEAEAIAAWNTRAYTTDEITLSGMHASGLPVDDVRVFGMTLDEVRQMMRRDAEREWTCENVGYYIDSTRFKCSACGYNGWTKWASDGRDRVPNYCPHCGAKVVGE